MKTREKILLVAFDEMYYNGYYATTIDNILKKVGIQKGTLYYYFKSKKELTLCVIKEQLSEYIETKYSVLLDVKKNICNEMLKLIKSRKNFDFAQGCKLNNLVQELSSKDPEFKDALEEVYYTFENIFEKVLNNAVEKGEIRCENTKSLSMFIVASIEGCLGTAKKSQNGRLFSTCISQLEMFLDSLRNKEKT